MGELRLTGRRVASMRLMTRLPRPLLKGLEAMLRRTVRMEEMRPADLIAARDAAPVAYNAFGPIEWHSYHLPFGTDPMVGEELCVAVAEEVGGVVFPTFYAGLDAARPAWQKEMFGLPVDEEVVGMDWPALPMTSEYWTADEARPGLLRRFRYMREIGFRVGILMTCHGGPGQRELAGEVAEALTDPPAFSVYAVGPGQMLEEDLKAKKDFHAEQRETAYLLGWRPELVDLTALPEGELRISEFGIIHDAPVMPAEFNPRESSFLFGNRLASSMRRNLVAFVRGKLADVK